jgi:hypothetical protein
MNFKMQIILLV